MIYFVVFPRAAHSYAALDPWLLSLAPYRGQGKVEKENKVFVIY